MARSTISYLWRDHDAPRGFKTGVSLHSHTNQSSETLDFLANLGNQFSVLRPFLSRMERRAETVRNYLVKLGVPADEIGVSWRGKENPRVPTPDGVREPQNRRVTIVYDDGSMPEPVGKGMR